MVKSEVRNKVVAYGRLLELSACKRSGYAIKTSKNDVIDEMALSFNQLIKESAGLDVFELESKELLNEYEDIVSQYLTDYTHSHIIKPDKEQMAKLNKNTYEISSDYLRSLDLAVAHELRDQLGQHFPDREIIDYCRKADLVFANSFGTEEPCELYLNKVVRLRGKERLMFFNITRPIQENDKPTYQINKWHIGLVGVFLLENYEHLVPSPVETFFEVIDAYGVDMEIEGKKYRYVYETAVNKDFTREKSVKLLEIKNSAGAPTLGHLNFKIEQNEFKLRSAFVVRQQDLIKDFITGNI